MKLKKIFILLPDGVGLRNFAFTSFVELGEQLGWEVIFWNHTPFNLTILNLKEEKLTGRPRFQTDLLKRAKREAELNHFTAKFNDQVFQTYKFPASKDSFKAKLKSNLVHFLVKTHKGEEGLQRLRTKMKISERKGKFYKKCKEVLEREKPDLIFCTNQRPVNAIAPLTAAQDLNIPTASFIFSWDNLPKATMVVDVDYYFVWSDYMKEELLNYYAYVKPKQIIVTGTPQFEPHFNPSLRKSKREFFAQYKLDLNKKYICFSGDDITTSPDDPQYLNDLAEAVKELNCRGKNLGIIFRRCPVDFSGRYEEVVNKYKKIVFPIAPKWTKAGENWNTILPTKDDLELQVNTIVHSEAVVNLGSSMVFDFAVLGKPCLFINYETEHKNRAEWSIKKIYNYKHFRSMPVGDEVYWVNSKKDISLKLELALHNPDEKSEKALKWFKKINLHPASEANKRIWDQISRL